MTEPTVPIPKPVPTPTGPAAEFFEHCGRGELRFQRCRSCRTWRHPPTLRCAVCGSEEYRFEPSTGRGTVFIWTTVFQASHPAFIREAPYAVVVAEMEEGVRLVANLPELPVDELRIGLPVGVYFEQRGDVALPMFHTR